MIFASLVGTSRRRADLVASQSPVDGYLLEAMSADVD